VRVLVDQAVEDRSSADLQGLDIGPDAAGNVSFVVGGALGDALVRPGRVVVRLVFGQDRLQMSLADDQHAIRSSRRRVPIRRSQIAFMRGTWKAVRRILVPLAWKTASKEAVKFDPRSRMRNLMPPYRSLRVRARLRAC
jgi:hypothetical protein